MKYRKKPVEIDAMQWDGTVDGATKIIDWVLATGQRSARYHHHDEASEPTGAPFIAIDTLEGTMRATAGDFVIRGVQGEHYPCKPDIFAATYDAATEV